MVMSINVIIENKIKYEMGQLYNYLNQIEDTLFLLLSLFVLIYLFSVKGYLG